MDEYKPFLVNAFIQFLDREKSKREDDLKFLSKLNAAISFLTAAFILPVDDSSLKINLDLEEIFYFAVRYDLNPRNMNNTKTTNISSSDNLNQLNKNCTIENTYSCKEKDKTLLKSNNVISHKRAHSGCDVEETDLNQRSKMSRRDNVEQTNYDDDVDAETGVNISENDTDCDIDIKEEIFDEDQYQDDPLAYTERENQYYESIHSCNDVKASSSNSHSQATTPKRTLQLSNKQRLLRSNIKASAKQEETPSMDLEISAKEGNTLETQPEQLQTPPKQKMISEQPKTPSNEQSNQVTNSILKRLNKKVDTILELLNSAEKERTELKEIVLRLEGKDRLKSIMEELSSLVCYTIDELKEFDSQWFENPEPALLQYLKDMGNIGEFLSKHCKCDLLGSLQESDFRELKMFKVAVGSTLNPDHQMKFFKQARSK